MVRILLVDDHLLVRRGLRAEIEVHEGMQVVAEAGTTVEALERLALLSEREAAVLRLMVEGATNREIAAGLGLAVKTVETHVHSILCKLHQPSRRAVVAWARRHRVTEYTPTLPRYCFL